MPASPTSVKSPDSPESSTGFLLPLAELDSGDSSRHPLRIECARIVATFLKPGSRQELTLDSTVRDTAIRNVMLSSHPDVVGFPFFHPVHSPDWHNQFLPVYEEIYNMLEATTLPRFLAFASANINLPKQIFWYCSSNGVSYLFSLTSYNFRQVFSRLLQYHHQHCHCCGSHLDNPDTPSVQSSMEVIQHRIRSLWIG